MNTFVDYLRSARAEAFKVSWPSKEDTIRYSTLVIGASIGLALAFAAIDFGFTKLFQATLLEQVARNRAAAQQEQQAASATTTPEKAKPQIDIDATSAEGDKGAVKISPLDLEAVTTTK